MSAVADTLRDTLIVQYPSDVIEILNADKVAVESLREVSDDALLKIVERAGRDVVLAIFNILPLEKKVAIFQGASTRTTIQLLHGLSPAAREEFLTAVSPAMREEIENVLAFPRDMAGSYMESTPSHLTIEDTIDSTLSKLRASSAHRIRSIYVVDDENTLIGRVDMQDIAFAKGQTKLAALANPVEGFALLTTPRDELIEIFNRFRVDSIPIVDPDHRLTGVVRYASIFQAAEESLTGDMQKMVGVSLDERALSTARFAVRKRLPWLHINLLTAFLAASVVGIFESTIAQFTALAILLPVVAGQSGNAGSQALAVTMRGLALREINLMKWRQVLMKEIRVGTIDGCALAITCGLGVYIWSQSFGLALVIGIAMIISMIAAGISGALVPMVLIRLGQDPATASSIILTTVTDVAGFISFLGTATLLTSIL